MTKKEEKEIDKAIEEKLKEAYGYSDAQLLAEFEEAEKQLRENPELLEEMKAKEGGFEKILERLKQIEENNKK